MSKFSTVAYVTLSLLAALSANSRAFAQGSFDDCIVQNDKIAQLEPFFPRSIQFAVVPFTEVEKLTMKSDLPIETRMKSDLPVAARFGVKSSGTERHSY